MFGFGGGGGLSFGGSGRSSDPPARSFGDGGLGFSVDRGSDSDKDRSRSSDLSLGAPVRDTEVAAISALAAPDTSRLSFTPHVPQNDDDADRERARRDTGLSFSAAPRDDRTAVHGFGGPAETWTGPDPSRHGALLDAWAGVTSGGLPAGDQDGDEIARDEAARQAAQDAVARAALDPATTVPAPLEATALQITVPSGQATIGAAALDALRGRFGASQAPISTALRDGIVGALPRAGGRLVAGAAGGLLAPTPAGGGRVEIPLGPDLRATGWGSETSRAIEERVDGRWVPTGLSATAEGAGLRLDADTLRDTLDGLPPELEEALTPPPFPIADPLPPLPGRPADPPDLHLAPEGMDQAPAATPPLVTPIPEPRGPDIVTVENPHSRDSVFIPEDRARHILDGEGRSGGHRHGTGTPGKTEFPARWSDDDILEAIKEVAGTGAVDRSAHREGDLAIVGEVDGVILKAIVKASGEVRTGYPLSGDGVGRNPR
ncbi:MAG: EndoU domain-containing protein [Pseudomonadota bacterium]